MYIGKVQMEAVLIMSVNISLIGTPIPPYPSTLLHGRLRQIDDIQLATPLPLSQLLEYACSRPSSPSRSTDPLTQAS